MKRATWLQRAIDDREHLLMRRRHVSAFIRTAEYDSLHIAVRLSMQQQVHQIDRLIANLDAQIHLTEAPVGAPMLMP